MDALGNFGASVEGVHFGEGPIQPVFEICKAAHTIESEFSREIGLQDQSLWSFADIGDAFKESQFKIFPKSDILELKWEVVVVAEFFMDDEADVKAEGFF